jgi:CRISPR system Cascade subunit CasB
MHDEIKTCVGKRIARLTAGDSWAKAGLAKLRRGIAKPPGELPQLFELTIAALPDHAGEFAETAVYTALTLFAMHQQGKTVSVSVLGNGFGKAVRRLASLEKGDNFGAVKRRFDAALTSDDLTEFANHARGLISQLKASDIPLDYPQFAADLYCFQFLDSRNYVRLKWGRDFYREYKNTTENNTEEEN